MVRFVPPISLLAALLSGCASTINTLPPLAKAETPIREHTLLLPPGLEVRSVDYDAALYSDVSGTGNQFGVATSTSVGGRAFVKVYAVERNSGEQVLLLYENFAERARPIQIIRFRSDSPSTHRE